MNERNGIPKPSGILKAGAGRTVITPPIGTQLYGYARDRFCTSINDDLTATAVALEYGTEKCMLISATLCMISNSISDELRKLVAKATGIPSANVILSSTHTHSGPIVGDTPGWGFPDTEYIDKILKPGILKAAGDAVDNLQPALLGIGTVRSDVGVNRREVTPEGKIVLGQNPWGVYDPVMTVLSLRSKGDVAAAGAGTVTLAPGAAAGAGAQGTGIAAGISRPIVNIVHYCAHCTAAGASPEVTRDWPGPMIDRLEKESGAITAFFNGAEGDIAPRISNGRSAGSNDISYAMELGAKAALDAVSAYMSIKEYRPVSLKTVTGDIRLPYKPLPSAETAKHELELLGKPVNTWGTNYRNYIKWNRVLDEYSSGAPHKTHFCFNQTLVALGPVLFIPFPYEIFVEITLRLRTYSPYQHTLCLSNTNGSNAYFPSQTQLCLGGYEIWFAGTEAAYALMDDADNAIIQENLRLMKKL